MVSWMPQLSMRAVVPAGTSTEILTLFPSSIRQLTAARPKGVRCHTDAWSMPPPMMGATRRLLQPGSAGASPPTHWNTHCATDPSA